MNIEQIEQFNKREEVIRLIQDSNEKNKQLEILHKEKDAAYKDCWLKTTQRIKNSEIILEKLAIGQEKLQNSFNELSLTVKSKAIIYDKHIEELDNQKERVKGMKQLIGILKYIIACGGGALILKLIQNYPW